MTTFLNTTHAQLALPELILVAGAIIILMVGAFRQRTEGFATIAAVLVLGLAGIAVLMLPEGRNLAFGGAFVSDDFARVFKALVLFGSAVSLILAWNFMENHRIGAFEYPVLVLLATAGMLMMISANDLIALYMGLELQSLALYVVAAFDRDSEKSSEAGLKYFVLGALSSGMLLYGASLIYGFTGTLNYQEIAVAAQAAPLGAGLIFGLVFLMAGLAFKVSAVPFHMWTPDVYEGAPTPVTAFLASAPKAAAMALFVRILMQAFPGAVLSWQQVIVVIAILSMVLGAFAAIAQTNIKRLMAYSAIANMGFALVGLAAGSIEGVQGVILYMGIYLMMTLGTFACILAMRRNGRDVVAIGDLAGLAQNDKVLAFMLAVFMFSLAGIPPLAGFFSKYYVFAAAVKAGLWPLAILGVLASVVGAYYYLRIVKVMYFDAPAEKFAPMALEVRVVAVIMALFTLGFIAFAEPLMALAAAAAKSLSP